MRGLLFVRPFARSNSLASAWGAAENVDHPEVRGRIGPARPRVRPAGPHAPGLLAELLADVERPRGAVPPPAGEPALVLVKGEGLPVAIEQIRPAIHGST